MASRSSVTVTINARNNTRAGVRALRNDIDNLRRQLPPDHTIYVNLNDDQALNRAGRLRRNLRNLPDNVVVRVSTVGPDRRDTNRITRTLTRSLTGPFRIMGRALGGILSDGLGQGIIGAFRAAGPVGMVVLAGIIAASLSVIGAALSGLLVAAFGLAFVGIGAAGAFQAKEVQNNWKKTAESIKRDFADVGEAMIPVVQYAIDELGRLSNAVAPVLKKALEDTRPATTSFVSSIFEGIRRMGKAMFDPIMDAWNVFAPILGDVLSDSMEMWGESFADMAELVRNNSSEIEMALRIVMKVIDLIIDTVTFLGKMWVYMVGQVGDAIGGLIEFGLRPLTTAVLEAFSYILEGAASAFGWVPGIGDDLEKAKDSFNGFKESVYDTLDGIAQKAYSWDETMSRTNKKRVLKADISKWESELRRARKDLKNTTSQKAEAKVLADIRDLENKLRRARGQLQTLNGQVARTYVYTTYTDIHTSLGTRQRRHGLRTGGVAGIMSAATGGIRANQTLVGEDGPEIVDLPFGSRVKSNPDSRRQMAGGGSGGMPTLQINAGNSELDRLLLHILRNAIRAEGGDVQVVLGTGNRS